MSGIISKVSLACAIYFLASTSFGQVASGGIYRLEQSDFTHGGGISSSAFYSVHGNNGHHTACSNTNGNAYGLRCGFWTPLSGPTAATASISGRVLRVDGAGIRNVFLTLSGGRLTSPRISRSSALGYFSFDEVEVGQTYVISVSSKRFGFAVPSQTVSLIESITDLTFTSSWEN